ncbi:MAG: SPFH domain-containing protein [Spirochaetales bacterium]|nr:SPFH domain-containing protein [Spirochaetales bacterium]
MSQVKYTEEKILKPIKGFVPLFLIIVFILASIGLMILGGILIDEYDSYVLGGVSLGLGILLCIASSISFAGLKVINPNEAIVLSLFGKYIGTIYENGFWYVNPFASAIYPQAKIAEAKNARLQAYAGKKSQAEVSASEAAIASAKKVSTKVCTFVNGNQKVNDKLGNPVEVSAIVIWKVVNATKAVLNVDYYKEYLSNQTDSTIRNVARLYPYDIIDDEDDEKDEINEKTLRGSATIIAEEMKKELASKVEDAGIEIVEVRLNQIAYAPEIAAAMLQRQQAIAVIAARKKIVEGAVTMVEMALDKLKEDDVVDLDEERKAQMVSNLLVVLCSSKEANPILNAGSIY